MIFFLDGRQLDHGYCEFCQEVSAEIAVNKFNGMMFNRKAIRVKIFNPKNVFFYRIFITTNSCFRVYAYHFMNFTFLEGVI